ncbi:uncharacterized protein LOC132059517 isoform X1 [Lycium ferocissimum]|uniref:uncharacterized protein LOC132059517 isoform X1 n=1 Tax=Lycium ferocissimum TaxID=112874 RepID=UPI002815C624|nr:uncharacterized protein LOC132059517 isoform X1 [Lycium ferocissimum]XP_059308124.1 uncharacterized protein LOC132059517 isoform X1 [Lycium ferocissimum]XP_059308125.1 uncharacterized protein LOC132059517 isoform X1 [Lycium ferocissimum]XP_059308126.1 uncharacterized protein LOC132059517 isoform X1 [Lycium ferocissimum]XP_059308128.1 uncharacterized protein LOC132059517 isoform X1 [Lycium ferocissimum]
MKSKTPSRNGNYVEKQIGKKTALNKSNGEVDFGNLIWVQLDGQSWLGQVVDEKAVGGNRKPPKKVAGEVLVRLYGSYTYLYVDPIKSQLEYEKIIEKYHGSHIKILGEALKQDLLHLKSGGMKMEDIKSKEMLRAGASQGKGNNKSQDMTPSTSEGAKTNAQYERKMRNLILRNRAGVWTNLSTEAIASPGEYTPSGRRMKVMQALGLVAPPGSPFHQRVPVTPGSVACSPSADHATT